jgi:Leucine-rich repeat (LRR) protein
LELNLDSCPCGDWAVAYLADNNVVPNLTSLDLADTDLTDAGLAHLAKLQLKKLSLFYCNISNDGLRHLSTMTSLEVLNLDSRDVSDEGMVFLQKLPQLRSLDIFSGRITDIGCMYLSRIKSLENLELCGGGVSDRGCASLAQNERITNRGAAALAALGKLKCLNLSNTKVNAGALGFLGSLIHLKSLAMYGCQGIDNCNSIDVLRNGLPSLKCLRLNNGVAEKTAGYEEEDNGMSDIEDSEEYSSDENE